MSNSAEMPTPDHFAAVIRRTRRSLRWSQEELAVRSGVSVGAIKDVEFGRNCYWMTLASLAGAMGVKFSALVSEAEACMETKSVEQLIAEQRSQPIDDVSVLGDAITDEDLDELVAKIYRDRKS